MKTTEPKTPMLLPTEDRLIIKPKVAEKYSGKLIIPNEQVERPDEGTVVAVGPGRFQNGALIPMRMPVGAYVLYAKYSGIEIKHGGDDLIIVREEDIVAVVPQ